MCALSVVLTFYSWIYFLLIKYILTLQTSLKYPLADISDFKFIYKCNKKKCIPFTVHDGIEDTFLFLFFFLISCILYEVFNFKFIKMP